MKKLITTFIILTAALCLSSCGKKAPPSTEVTALVMDGEHYTIEVSSVSLKPGSDASFLIETDSGYEVTETDYTGEYRISPAHGLTKLELVDVRYPTRVRLTLSNHTRTVTYIANGGDSATGEGKSVVRSYDISYHTRPNVSIGTDIFTWEGYTLTCWNTEPDGTGDRVGLGSRVTVSDSLTLYAQWAKWTEPELFTYEISDNSARITGYSGGETTLVIPEALGGYPVTVIGESAFKDCGAESVILPKSIVSVEENAFAGAKLRVLSFFDNIEYITDGCFAGCDNLSTLRISAIEDPYGYSFRRESVLADKLDLLITTMGEKRLVFYGGCSMWYNLIGPDAQKAFDGSFTVINMGLNGVTSSIFQMELMANFITENDIIIHTPEISSSQQLLLTTGLSKYDDKLWCAMEYNYDLVSLLDMRRFDGGVLESLRLYLDKKKPGGRYTDIYHDSKGYEYFDETGSIPYYRDKSAEKLVDTVLLDPDYLSDLSRLEEEYGLFTERGARIYVSYASIDIESVPEEQQGNIALMGKLYTEKFSCMNGVAVISEIYDFIYHDADFYDTVYHLLTIPAQNCTRVWIRDIKSQLSRDGLWVDGK
ncbi:MAG: leucine-rich repeat protein [Oscillospiraceae bacterium]|nr:leucine-rich repeat protein [Oscillospiraceae bacterium]